MFDRHEYAGLWWEPERESGVLLGTLTIGQGRPVLEVQEDFGQTLISGTGRGRNYPLEKKPRIVGGDDESLITLEEVQGLGRGAQGMGPRTAHYEAQVALEGKRFAQGERVAFDEISIRASDLNAWTQVSGFKTILETESVDEKDRVVATEVRYEAPEDIRIPLAQGEEIIISFVCMGKGLAGDTHYDPGLEKRAARGGALLLLTTQLQTTLEMSLLGELGFSDQAVEEILDRSHRFAQIEHLREQVAGGDGGEG